MNDDQSNQGKLLDTTDCLEAIGVFRVWKNFLFIILILILLLLQGSFWLVNVGFVKAEQDPDSQAVTAADEKVADPNKATADANEQAAKQAVDEYPNQPVVITTKEKNVFNIKPTTQHLTWLVRFLDFILIPASILYCLTMLFSLKVSLIGRLGGINHISRAFFLSLLFLVLLLPWQKFFNGVVAGAIYTPSELLRCCAAVKEAGIFGHIFHYLRFTGYWLLVMLLLILSQIRSARSAKLILRRLEVV